MMDEATRTRLAARVERIRRLWAPMDPRRMGPTRDLHDLLAAYDALRAERDDLTDRLGNVKQQRDQARREATHWEYQAKAWSRHGRGEG